MLSRLCVNKDLKFIRKMSVFAQRLNALTGRCEWEQQTENYDYHQEVARSAFADMLHDTERNKKYEAALKLAIDKMHADGKKANVLDIGTGTGLLSMMAVRCGADTVTACEAFGPMAKCAHKIIDDNGMSQHITIVPKRSTDMNIGETGDMKHKANILVTEVFDTELIGEGAIGTFSHAHKFLLEKDSIVIPNSGTIFAQVVECNIVQAWNKVKSLADDEGDIMIETPPNAKNCPGAAAVHDIQLSQLPLERITLLTDPIPVMTFDWSGKTELVKSRSSCIKVKSKADGSAQAIFMWWSLSMDFKNEVLLSCAPYWAHPDSVSGEFPQDSIPWRDHWMQAVYYTPNQMFCKQNQYFNILFSHDEYSLWFNILPESKLPTCDDYKAPVCLCGMHCAYSRTRIGQLNDGRRNKMYLRVLNQNVNSETVCLILSDGSLLGLSAVKMGAKHAYCLENNFLSKQVLQSYIEHNKLADRVTIINNIDELQKSNCMSDINLIFAEPNFITSVLPWDNAYFAYIKERLGNLDNVKVIPESGIIWMMPTEFKDLHKIRAPLKKCEGFLMEPFDKLIENASNLSDSMVEPQPLWEYPNQSLGNPIKVLDLDFSKPQLKAQSYSGQIRFDNSGICNGVALWIDWNLDGKNIWSTGPNLPVIPGKRQTWDMFTRQGVHLFQNPQAVDATDYLQYKTTCNTNKGELHFGFKILKN